VEEGGEGKRERKEGEGKRKAEVRGWEGMERDGPADKYLA